MRVALVSDWFFPRHGGIESHLGGLARALRQRAVEPLVITSTPGPDEVAGVNVLRLPVDLLPGAGIAWSPRLGAHLRQALRSAQCDLVHIHPSLVAPVCLAGAAAARRLDLPAIFTFHSSMSALPALLRGYDRLSGWARREGVMLSGVSHRIAQQLQRIDPELSVHILPNGHDSAFWRPAGATRPLRNGAPLRIVTAMRLEATKRPLALPAIFRRAEALAAAHGRRLELHVAGDGSHGRALHRAIQSGGLEKKIRTLGWLDRDALRTLYRGSHLFMLPSIKESFGIAALEARAAGLPVLGRAGTGLADFIRHGEDGFFAEDDEGMAQAIAEFAAKPALLAAMSGSRPALARLDWNAIAEQHEHLYRRALSDSRAAAPLPAPALS